ncbi:MAG: c-type heme family protein [Desulfuromonadaceae bacterium]
MHHSHKNEHSLLSRKINLFAWILVACWTLLIGVSWFWNFHADRKVLHKVALAEAQVLIERDAQYRRWGASHGGVYVPATPQSPPNPHLSHVPDRDIFTPSGQQLTLINPAYMARQVNEHAKSDSPSIRRIHITSLKPLRPENTPDPWEEAALRSFESGAHDVSAVVTMDNKQHMRLMVPLTTEQPCLKCHAFQGYTAGSVRGGISVSVPLQPLIDASRGQTLGSIAFHGTIWLLGLGASTLGARQLSRSARVQKQVERELHEQTVQLEEEIADRQRAQESLQTSEAHLRIVADYASNWEYWRLPDASFLYMSPSALNLTGYSVEEFYSNRELFYRVVHPYDRELFMDHTHIVDSNGQILPLEIRIVCKNGAVRWISHICQQVYTPEGLPWGWRASNHDITERKQMEYELLEQTELLEEEVSEREAAQASLTEMNRSLEERINMAVTDLRDRDQALIQQGRLASMGEMINNIAHQWRQPLNNVGLIIQSLKYSYDAGTMTGDELEHEISTAMDVIMHMSRTIDDFRNFFRGDKQEETFIVSKTVHHALDFVSAALSSHRIAVELEEDETVTATGYQNEYAQVLLNILSNAREACVERGTAAPRIHIRITGENSRSVVYIRDNCGGIADDIMPKIFDPYFTTRAPDKGTGIGLYMSKVIIEQNMGGHLTASNTEDGVEFRVEV